VLTVTLTGTELGGSDVIPLRLLNPGGGNAAVWRLDNGSWRSVPFEKNGQYLLLEMTGTENTFCVQPLKTDFTPIIVIAAAIIAVTAIIIVAVKSVRKKRAKSEKKTTV
ncbi:MAG: hypothetical protein NC401_18665, partial [Ruminococcus sp.]|nr:hypothetical protein [Ruminococcus sp.]